MRSARDERRTKKRFGKVADHFAKMALANDDAVNLPTR